MLWKLNVLPNLKIDMLWRGHLTDFMQFTWPFDLSSVLITYVFGNSLIKISFEAKVISSKWKLKAMPSYHNFTAFYKKLTNADVGCFSDEGE